jgi:putative tryptophan/tyrosine transport system substrate-binding protein
MQKLVLSSILAATLAFVLGFPAEAQQPKTVFRIGYLSSSDPVTDRRIEGIRQRLREFGYIEGQNITIEYRYGEGKPDRASHIAAEFMRLKVDVIVVSGGNPQIQAVMNVTKTIPIVMAGQGSDPVAGGQIDSLARPGGNVTGLTILNPELGGKRLELLKEAVPKLARVAVLYDLASQPNVLQVKEYLPPAACALKLTLQPWELRAAGDLDRVFAAMGKQRPDGLYVTGGPLLSRNGKRIAGLALKSRLPSMCTLRTCVEVVGGLMSYAADLTDNARLVAWYVDKILKGAKPADLPVQQPTKFEFVINLQTAKQIGLTIPPNVLARANRLIK